MVKIKPAAGLAILAWTSACVSLPRETEVPVGAASCGSRPVAINGNRSLDWTHIRLGQPVSAFVQAGGNARSRSDAAVRSPSGATATSFEADLQAFKTEDSAGRLRGILASALGITTAELEADLTRVTGPSLDSAMAFLNADETSKLLQQASGDRAPELELRRSGMIELSKRVASMAALDGGLALAINGLYASLDNGAFSAFAENLTSPQRMSLQQLQDGIFLLTYFRAYFRGGKIFSLKILDEGLKSRIRDAITSRVSTRAEADALKEDVERIVGEISSAVCSKGTGDGCLTLGVIGEETLVTRSGKSYGFPGVDASFDPFEGKKISAGDFDEGQIASDLVRVAIEALADARSTVPTSVISTACKVLNYHCIKNDQEDAVKKLDASADRLEAASRSTTSLIVRGGWLFALNNEALSTMIETAVSVAFRKGAEQRLWSLDQSACAATERRAPLNVRLRLR